MNTTDANPNGLQIPPAIDPQKKRTASIPVERDSPVYNMQHKRRGKAYIFNQEEFDASWKLPERVGSSIDESNLKQALSHLDFDVLCFKNYDIASVRKEIKQLAEEDHTDNDCVMIIVLTHGGKGEIYASDIPYHPDELWLPFKSDTCPSLAGKPKLFIIQACQGGEKDAGTNVQYSGSSVDSVSHDYSISTLADFMVASSTIPGYVSWRQPKEGTWFIGALCQVLLTHGRQEDLLSMMTMMQGKVATLGREYSQIPSVVSQLIRRVNFPPKK